MSEFKKLTKGQEKSVAILFIEGVSIPMLILSTTTLFTALSTFQSLLSIYELVALIFCVTAIPLLGVSIFFRKAVFIYEKKVKATPKSVLYCETFGFSLSAVGFFTYLFAIAWWLCVASVLSSFIALLVHINYLKGIRSVK